MITPAKAQALIRPEPAHKTTASGIHIPESARAEQGVRGPGGIHATCGEVLRVGPGVRHRKTGVRLEPEVRPGDRVVYDLWAAVDWQEGDETLHLVDDGKILAVLEEGRIG